MQSHENQEKFLKALYVLQGTTPPMSLTGIRVFLCIGENNGVSQDEVRQQLDLRQETASRAINRLTARGYKNHKPIEETPGLGLIRKIDDFDDYKRNRLYLTDRGLDLYQRFHQTLKGGFSDV